MYNLKIKNCFDSHTHFLATGQVACELHFRECSDLNEILQKVKSALDHPLFRREEWIVGFGWNEQNLNSDLWAQAHRQLSSDEFQEIPIFLSRIDGHSSLINEKALSLLEAKGFDLKKFENSLLVPKQENKFIGILKDQAHIEALLLLPDFNDQQKEQFILESQKKFRNQGVTHIRDLSLSYHQWQIQKKLILSHQFFMYYEGFVTVENIQDCERGYAELLKCKSDPHDQMRALGLKIFIDGSLGSETAYLTEPYLNQTHHGILLWQKEEIKQMISFCWRHHVEIAIHTIGDQALKIAAEAAREVSAFGLLGKIHFEHAQVLDREVIKLLKPLHVTIHMQPCHWLSDKKWIHNKLNQKQLDQLFDWHCFLKNRIPLQLGSDSPIENPSVLDNFKAICDRDRIKPLSKKEAEIKEWFQKAHSHPDKKWGSFESCFSQEGHIEIKQQGHE